MREKSEAQLGALRSRFFGTLQPDDAEFAHREERLREFGSFVDALIPVRADVNGYEEYVSPERSGNIKSFGPQDALVHSERFVYGSFAGVGHLMSQGHDQHTLDAEDIAPRAQIAMQDIANIVARTNQGDSFMQKYLQNLFDWENGKKILALYLAGVFDTPQQARDALSITGGRPYVAQRWETAFYYSDSSFTPRSAEEFQSQKLQDEQLTQTFIERMRAMLEDTGIEPPLSLEIRVKDTAKTVQENTKSRTT